MIIFYVHLKHKLSKIIKATNLEMQASFLRCGIYTDNRLKHLLVRCKDTENIIAILHYF